MIFQSPPLDDAEIAVLAKVGEATADLRLRLREKGPWTASSARHQFARSLQAAGALAGFAARLDDVAAIDLGELPIDLDEGTFLALKGCRDALTYVANISTDDDFDYSTQLLKSVHFIMGSYDVKDRAGRWRANPSGLNDATIGYAGPPVRDVPELMSELVGSLKASDGSPPLVRAAMAHLNLFLIQPFDSCNGRMARCLHTLVFARQGVLTPTHGSIDEYLARNSHNYVEALADVGADANQTERVTQRWVRLMLTAHLRQAQSVRQRLKEHELIWRRLEKVVSSQVLPERSLVALFDASLGSRVRSTTYRASLERASLDDSSEPITEATASRDLRQLADVGLLEAVGEKRGRHYRATSDIEAIRKEIKSSRTKKVRSDPFL